MKLWYVYMMASKPNGVIYIGVTDNLEKRIKEHKLKIYPKSFTVRYNCDKLVCFEEFDNGNEASIKEKQMKRWKRDWKVKLIEDMNLSWMDMSMNWNINFNETRDGR